MKKIYILFSSSSEYPSFTAYAHSEGGEDISIKLGKKMVTFWR